MKFLIDSTLFSYAQIFFSNRRWFGGIALAVTFIVPSVGLMALLGVTIANLAAYILKFDESKIRSGFYGFNGILFGAASVFYFELTMFTLVLGVLFIIITFFVSAVLEHMFASMFNLPGLSVPFVLSLYAFIIFLTNFDSVSVNVSAVAESGLLSSLPVVVQDYFKSLAIILFQPNAIAGVVFAVSLLFLSRVMFILSVIGFAASTLTTDLIFQQPSESFAIIAGFNAILTALALGGSLIIPSKKSVLLTIISSVMIVIVTGFFAKLLEPRSLPILVLPFNAIVLSVIYSLKFRREHSDLVLLYFQPGTPEENFYYHHNRVSRFERFKTLLPELPFYGEWTVSQGYDGTITHKDKWRFAWDFVVTDESQSEFNGAGTALKDFYCHKLPVVAPLDGTIARIVNGIPDNPIGETNLKTNWGNTVIIDHGHNTFSSLSHLEPHSIKVSVGDRVKQGDTVGACGNSGRSPTPHVHFQFQLTDKVGDKTIAYPFGQYLERNNNSLQLHSFDFPSQGMKVMNVRTHKVLKRAFDFTLGDTFAFRCTSDGKAFDEEWEVKVDIYNTLYLESTNNATVNIVTIGKVFYLTNFIGNKSSALYHFYIAATQVPLCYEPTLRWTDQYPLSKVLTNQIRYISELLLIFRPQFAATAAFSFDERTTGDFIVSNAIAVQGSGLFRFYERGWKSSLAIDEEGNIHTITVRSPDKKEFHAEAIIQEEE